MAKGITSGGALHYRAQLDISEALKNAQKLKAELKSIGSNSFDTKPLTAYQAEQLKIKQQAIDLAKQKQEQAKAEKSASLVLQDALKQERLAREAINTQIAANRLAQQQANQAAKEQAEIQKQIANQKRPTQVSNSSAEIAKYNAGTLGTNGQINTAFTAYLREVKKDFDSGKISAQQYVAELERYSAATLASNNATRTQTATTQAATKSKQELAQIEAINTLRVNENNAARRVAAKEAINEKGSIEQRKAALERLLTTYKRLNDEERNTSYGQRMGNTIAQLRVQIKGLEDQTKKMASTSVTSIDQYKASLQRLLAAYTALSKEQRDTVAGAKLAEMIRNLRDQIKGLDDDTKSSKKGIAGIFEYLKNNISSALGAIALLTAAWNTAKSVFAHNVEISDNFTDVQRTAKLSKEEVSEFGKELKKLDTRTDLEHLLDVGFIGGRLSVPKQDLEDFVKQVDELAVVLKKEFPGGAEAVAESLGKIVTIYKITETEGVSLGTALSKVGSTLLELAHSGPVTVKYLQDFTLGVAGTAASAKLSVPVISAYGAVLGESGQIASSAALAITRLVAGLTTKTAKYAAIAQLADSTLTVEKFTKVVNTDTKQALDLFFKGLKAGNPVATEFDGRLGSVGINTGKIMNAVKILANNQDKLTDRIRVSSKAFEEGTSVAHNFELANNNLAASVDKLKNSAVNLTTDPNSSLASFFKGIVDGSTYAIKAISDLDEALTKTQLENDRRIVARASGNQTGKDFLSGLFFGGSAKSNKEVDEARARIRENNSRILNEEIAARGKASANLLANGKDEIELRKLITGETEKQKIAYDRLANALAFVANPKNTGEAVETVSRGINKLREKAAQQRAVVLQLRSKLPTNTEVYGDGSLVDNNGDDKTPEALKAEIKALTATNAKLKIGSKELAEGVVRLKELKRQLKIALGGTDNEVIKAENQYQSALKAQRSLQEKLNEAGKKGKREELDGDKKELAEKTAFYENLRNLAKEHNDKVDKFNNDPKNKNQKKRIRVDAGVLLPGEASTVGVLKDNIAADELKTDLEKKKRYYEDFENFRNKVGKEKAEQRYKDLIDVNKTYRQYLDSLDDKLNGVDDTGKGADGGGQRVAKQLEVVRKERDSVIVEEEKKYQDLLAELVSYEQGKAAIIQQYEAKRAQLVKDNRIDEIKTLDKIHLESMAKFEDENVEKLTAFKELFNGIEDLSAEAAQRVVGNGKALIDSLIKKGVKLSPELKKQLEDTLKNATKSLKLRVPEELILIGNEIQNLAGFAGEVDDAFGKWVGTLGSSISGIGQLKKTMLDFKDLKKGDTLGALGLGAQAISIGASIFSGITKAITGLIQSAYQKVYERRVADNELQIKQSEAVSKALDRQLSLINKVYGTEKLTAYNQALKDIDATTENVSKKLQGMFLNTGNSELDRLIGLYNSGTLETKGFDRAKFNQLLDKGAFKNIDISDIEALRKLIGSGALDATAERYAQQLVDLKDKSVEAANAVKEALTGTTFESFADSIVDLFAKGTASAEDFGKNFEEIMKKSILNSFKTKTIATQLQAFYDQFAELSASGQKLTDDEVKILKAKYDAVIKQGQADFENLQKVSGINFLDNNNSNSTSVGKIEASVTEATATEWIGLVRAQYDISKRIEVNTLSTSKTIGDMYVIARQKLDLLVKIEANTYRTADNTESLKAIKTGIDTIVKNTTPTPGSTGYDRGK